LGRPELAPRCAAGAAHTLGIMDWSGVRGAGFCGVTPTDWKADCYRAVIGMLEVFGTAQQRTALCDSADSSYMKACRGSPMSVSTDLGRKAIPGGGT
jgi:hypothetical protein